MKTKGISGSTLKIIAIFAMVLDHIAWCLFEPVIRSDNIFGYSSNIYFNYHEAIPTLRVLSFAFHAVGRITFPIMLFLMVEGLMHTRSKKKYIRNMLVFALLSEVPFNLALYLKPFMFTRVFPFIEINNIFFTLALGLIAVAVGERIMTAESLPKIITILGFAGVPAFAISTAYYTAFSISESTKVKFSCLLFCVLSAVFFVECVLLMRKKDKDKNARLSLFLAVVTSAAWITMLFNSDYAFIGVVALFIMYMLKSKRTASYFTGCAYLAANNYFIGFSLLALPLIHFYNGKRGMNLKYFFYAFYPLHLIVLWMIKAVVF